MSAFLLGIPEKPILQSVISRTDGIAFILSSPNGTDVITNLTVTIYNVSYSITKLANNDIANFSGLYENMQHEIVISSSNCAGTSSTAVDIWTCKFDGI